MNLEPAEVAYLPLPAALLDRDGEVVARTPEWNGPAPGSAGYATGFGHLVIGAEGVDGSLDTVLVRLLAELDAAASSMASIPARRVEVLAAGLKLVSGRAPDSAVADVAELVAATLPARAPGLRLEIEPAPPWPATPSAAAIALALVQFAVNAQRHERASSIRLRLWNCFTFYIEWRAALEAVAAIDSPRHVLRRRRWGWGYVQMVADWLGGVALPPGPVAPGWEGAALSLGSASLALPLACVRDGVLVRCSHSWQQERSSDALGAPLGADISALVEMAETQPGSIVYRDLYRARHTGSQTWLTMAPETGSNRARDVLRGLDHERVLWSAGEPESTRVHALATLLAIALGEPRPSVPPGIWSEVFPAACNYLGLAGVVVPEALLLPDPRLSAFLLSELGGELVEVGEALRWRVPLGAQTDPLVAALGGCDGEGLVSLV